MPMFDLLLFDFDGLLVNTEMLHYEAYRRMFAERGYTMSWDFSRYCQAAHYSSEGLKQAAYATIPGLIDTEPDWDVLYKEKKAELTSLVEQGEVELMPGVADLMEKIAKEKILSCVVTNSPLDAVQKICKQHKALSVISDWITREQYENPKPAPDGYTIAIKKWAKPGFRVAGFEDSVRGASSLLSAFDSVTDLSCQAVVVTELPVKGLSDLSQSYSCPLIKKERFYPGILEDLSSNTQSKK